MESMQKLFMGLGLDAKKAKETMSNSHLSTVLKDVIFKAGADKGVEGKTGVLLYQIAARVATDLNAHQDFLVDMAVTKKIQTTLQLDAAFEYLKKNGATFKQEEFNEYCGVGVTYTNEEVIAAVTAAMDAHTEAIVNDRYQTNIGAFISKVKETLKWADGKVIKDAAEKRLVEILGPKTAADEEPKKKKKEAVKSKSSADLVEADGSSSGFVGDEISRIFGGDVARFHKPGENPQIDPALMAEHMKATGGRVHTRFPPEPNGFLHIGHAKAMNFNFRYAEVTGGNCYLRFDDTNPEAEEQRYFDSIKEMVDWLGFKPFQVTATSNYFDTLYEYAVRAIKNGKAYVCQMTAEEVHLSRGGDNQGPRHDSPYRNRPIEESLKMFQDMRDGKYKPGEVTLRLKMDMTSGNPYMWDAIAYRVLNKPHVRTGDKWVIYPTYDFSHCLTDSIENITHSLCTTEFQSARESYYWVCDAIPVYKPVQWEYGRLNITNTVLSKRKLMKLVQEGHVSGWDDPRLYTLEALRRRGFPPRAINAFCEKLGITTASTTIPVELLESCVRDELNATASRCKAILNPIKVTITNYPVDQIEDRVQPRNPTDPSKGETTVPFCNTIYIDASDFRDQDEPGYYRLAPGKEVGLARAYNITCQRVVREPNGKIVEIQATYDPNSTRKPKAYIHWVAHCPTRGSPIPIEVRLYDSLFKSAQPDSHKDGFLADINPNSLTVVSDALCDISIVGSKPGEVFQFERVGYFCLDKDSKDDTYIFNRTVSLKEDSKKN